MTKRCLATFSSLSLPSPAPPLGQEKGNTTRAFLSRESVPVTAMKPHKLPLEPRLPTSREEGSGPERSSIFFWRSHAFNRRCQGSDSFCS